MRRPTKEFVVGALIVILAISTYFLAIESDKSRIKSWCDEQQYRIMLIEMTAFSKGPFWYRGKDDRIYRVKVQDNFEKDRVVWFRINWWMKALEE